ncbi:NAD(+) synthase [archaeon]|jgi:NAD+ synthase|nr:NAD(+) synthase [archaeon]
MVNRIKLAKINYGKVVNEIGDFILDEITKIGYTGGVIGLSGGVDSTVSAALTKRAFDKYNSNHEKKLELIGYLLPSSVNNPEDLVDGKRVAEKLGIKYEIIDIQPFVKAYGEIDSKTMNDGFQKGNLMSELRALILHRKSALDKKLVVGTGNHDEDFGVGYYTLFGDGAVHLSPISGLSKRLVRELAIYFGFEEFADRIPSAGLESGQTDFGDLGYSYDFVELISCAKIQGFEREELRNHFQIVEMFTRDKENYIENYGKAKFENVEDALNDLFFRNKIAESKARIICPPSPKINLEYEK